ncbi:MAG: hypothetical protein ACI35W_03675 [Anaeroplasmataceae bacterium]
MKLKTKLSIIEWVLALIIIGIMLICKLLLNRISMWFMIVMAIILLIVLIIFEMKIKSLEKIEKQKEDKKYEEHKLKAFEIIKKNAVYDHYFSLMDDILNNEILEINLLKEKYELKIDFDYIIEENCYDVTIINDKNKKNILYISLSYCENKWCLLPNSDKEIVLTNETDAEIIELITQAIELFFKK